MRPAMGRAKQRDHRDQRRHRQTRGHRDQHAEDHDRGQDHRLDRRKAHAARAHRPARQHRAHEGHGQRPDRPPAQLRGQKAKRHHRQQVIGPADRMGQAVHELRLIVDMAGMGQRGRGQQGGGKCQAFHQGVHSAASRMGWWTVTSLVPSGKVASTWTDSIMAGMPGMH